MTRKNLYSSLMALSMGVMLLVVVGHRQLHPLSAPAHLAASVAALVAAAASIVFCLLYWRALDEAAKEAHKVAWYWGGTAGLAVAGGVLGALIAAAPKSLPRLSLVPGEVGLLVTGALLVIAAQLVGYVLVWAGWC